MKKEIKNKYGQEHVVLSYDDLGPELQCRLNTSLTNATVVEFTVHYETQLQSKFKDTVDSCLFLTVIRDANRCSLFQNVQGT